MRMRTICSALAAVLLLAPAALAGPAATDTNYFDGFVDTVGLDPFASADVELDALGGVRLKGIGPSEPGTWTEAPDFLGAISYRPEILIDNPLIPIPTVSATSVYGSLALPQTPLAFRRVQAEPVLGPPPALSVDGYGVGGMSVVKVGATYRMYYTGTPEDGSARRIYLATSADGVSWTKNPAPVLELGEPGTFDSRQLGKPSVLYDPGAPAGTPKFRMWYSAEGDLYGSIGYATSDDGLAWDKWIEPITVADAAGDVGRHASLAMGADGLPVVAYYDATNGDLKLLHCGTPTCASGNTILTLDAAGDVGQYASLAIGVDGLPAIAYYDATNGDLKLLHCGTAACTLGNTIATLDGVAPAADVGSHASLAIGPAGFPVVAYHDASTGDLKLAACNDTLCAGADESVALVDAGGAGGNVVGEHASLAFVATDPLVPATSTFPAVAYYDATAGDLKLVVCNDALCAGGDEAPAVLDGASADVGQHASLATGPAGFPVVAYYSVTGGDLVLLSCDDPLCAGGDLPAAVDGVDPAADVGRHASLSMGPAGFPVVAYYDATAGDLRLLACDDAACEGDLPAVVDGADPAADVGEDAALLVGPGGVPLIAYYDADNGDLKVAPGEREPREVLGPGLIGSIDSYTVSHPCVIFENGTFRMWYTANDSNNRRIAYAASTDGVTWVRGGLMIDLGNTANDDFGAWAPTVWKEGAAYLMVYTGWKPISGGTVVQSKLIEATSDNGTTWDTGAVTLNPGNQDDFDGYNLFLPFVLVDGPAPQYPKKMWYAGNNPDANGNFHDRIGHATKASAGLQGSWSRVAGAEGLGAVLGLGAQSGEFDSMYAADLSPVAEPGGGGGLLGFYTGTNAADFKPRIGVKRSDDGGITWEDVPGLTPGDALIGEGAAGQFDEGGVARPAPVDLGGSWAVYHTALQDDLTPAIGLHTVSHDLATVTRQASALVAGGTDPAAVLAEDGLSIDLYYALDVGGVWTLHRASYDAANPATRTAAPVALAFEEDPTCWDLDGGGVCDATLEDVNRNGVCELLEDLNHDGVCAPSEDVNGDGLCTVFDEDANGDGICTPLEDLTGDGLCTVITEDANGNGLCELGEDRNRDGLCVLADEDANADGVCDTFTEDVNGDGSCTVADCSGAAYDAGGMRHPLVARDGALWRIWYAAIGTDGVERVAYAESADGLAWTREGLAIDRATAPYDFAERGIRPSGVLAGTGWQLFVTGVDRAGWQRSGLLDGNGPGFVDGGTATYQYPSDAVLGDPGYLPRDWREISWTPPAVPEGTGAEVWVSYFPTASDMWSNFFRIDNGRDLPFLLTVKAMRWQLRLTGATDEVDVTPQVDALTVDSADIAFPASGRAVTIPVGPPPGRYLLAWEDLTVRWEANGGTLALEVRDQDGTPLVPSQAVGNDPGLLDLTGVPATSGKLVLVFTMTPNATATPPESPLLRSVSVDYSSTDVPSSITLVATPSSLYSGQSTVVEGWLESRALNPDGTEAVTALPDQTVVLKVRAAGASSWTVLDPPVTTDAEGHFAFPGPAVLTESTYYRAEWEGNVEVFGDGTVYPPAMGSILVEVNDPPVALTLVAAPSASILYGGTVALSGSLRSSLGELLAGQEVTIRHRPAGTADFVDLPTPLVLPVAGDGSFTTAGARVLKPLVNTEYQAVWAGGDALGTGIVFAETATVLPVGVRPKVTVALGGYASRSGKYYLYPAGSTLRISGRVTPKHYLLHDGTTRGTVTVDVYRQALVSGVLSWVPYRQGVRLLGSARTSSPYSWSWRAPSRGKYRVQTTFAAETHHDRSLSAWRYFRVY